MDNENETKASTTETNQDDLILAQQRQIEKEISDHISLVGDLEPITLLEQDYSNDEIYLEKVRSLAAKYRFIRRTRPDGNCFFRSFIYANIERLLDKKDDFQKFFERAEKSRLDLEQVGFTHFTVEDFHETYMDVLKKVKEVTEIEESKKVLHSLFNEQGYADYMVVYLRLLTSGQLQKEQDFYSNFIEGHRSVADFCHQEVEPMYKESDHIHIIAACAALNTCVQVVYLDRGTNKNATEHVFPEGSEPVVHLLYRPGHYDILYP